MHTARNRMLLVVAASFCSLPIIAWGCGGSDSPGIGSTNGNDSGSGADSTVTPQDDGGTGGDTGTGSDTGTVTDGGARDARNVVDAAVPSDPGQIRCGDAGSCNTAQDFCCLRERPDGGLILDAGGPVNQCIADNNALQCGLGRRFHCDEKADCPGGDVCCLDLAIPGGVTGSTCQNACPGIQPQLCRTDGECKGGAKCVSQVCGGTLVQTCGGLPAALCP